MSTLNTQDFLDAYKALDTAKYPSLPDTSYGALGAYLKVAIEFSLSVEETQRRLDEKTITMKAQLAEYLAETVNA
jgi:hypothetical protein